MQQNSHPSPEDIALSLAAESWRFSQVMQNAIHELPESRQGRYNSRLEWYIKKLKDTLETLSCHIEDYSERIFEPGMPLTVLNLDEFQEEDEIIIEVMIEPVIIRNDGTVVKTGTAMGRKG